MKVLITGGTGFIGANLALHYAGSGHQVVVLSKEATPAERQNAGDLKRQGVGVVNGSITNEEQVAGCLEGADLVFHVAAAMREANVPDSVFWQVNVEATRLLLERSRLAGARRFIYCSSIGAMGKNLPKPANEDSPCSPEDIYQVTKKAAEALCLDYYRQTGFPVAILRPADVYGPRDRRLLKLFKSIKKGRFVTIGGGQNEHHMLYINDLIAAFARAAEMDAAVGEVFIIAGECPVTVEQLVEMIASVTGGKVPRLRVPVWPVQLAARMMEAACRPLGIQPPLYPRRVDFFRSDTAFEISKAKMVLGYRPQVDLRTGLAETWKWYEQNGLV